MISPRLLGVLTALALAAPVAGLAQGQPRVDQPGAEPPATMNPPPPSDLTGPPVGVPIPADQLPPAQANALAIGDNKVVSNAPIPDTPENRAKYGGPKSHGGKATSASGN